MVADLALLALFFVLGLWAQRAFPGERLRRRAWNAYFWTVAPALVLTAFTTVTFDRGLGLSLAAAILAAWAVIGIGYLYAARVSRSRQERGALALAAGFPNTGFVGYPLAHLAFGQPGLALMVLYDRLAWLVPATAISTTIARLHGRHGASAAEPRRRLAALLANPPLLAALAAVGMRLAGLDLGPGLGHLASAAAAVVGPAGFFLLGLTLPLEPPSYDGAELRRAAGALAIRFAVAPLALLASGAALGADVPPVFYLGAAMPCAFHLVVLARVFDVRPQLVRLLVIASTVPAVAAIAAVSAVLR